MFIRSSSHQLNAVGLLEFHRGGDILQCGTLRIVGEAISRRVAARIGSTAFWPRMPTIRGTPPLIGL